MGRLHQPNARKRVDWDADTNRIAVRNYAGHVRSCDAREAAGCRFYNDWLLFVPALAPCPAVEIS